MDVFIGNTQTLKDNPDFAKAVVGAWYEALAILKDGGPKGEEMRAVMTSAMGTDAGGLQSQLDTTHFFYTPKEAADFLLSPENAKIWNSIRTFCFQQGLFGQGATSVDLDRHRGRRRHGAGRQGQHQDAGQRHRHQGRRRRQALTPRVPTSAGPA